MKKAAPSHKQSSPTQLQLTSKHYQAATTGSQNIVSHGALIPILSDYVLEVLL